MRISEGTEEKGGERGKVISLESQDRIYVFVQRFIRFACSTLPLLHIPLELFSSGVEAVLAQALYVR